MILFSVAHSHLAKGAPDDSTMVGRGMPWIKEYDISRRASQAAAQRLTQAGESVVLYDCGDLMPAAYSAAKVDVANRLMPFLAVEIHCNSNVDDKPNYSEVIYSPGSTDGARAAKAIADVLARGFASANHAWPSRGPRAQDGLFWLDKTNCPAVIVEGIFVSNPEQARWADSPGGAQAYGVMVAEGVLAWLSKRGP